MMEATRLRGILAAQLIGAWLVGRVCLGGPDGSGNCGPGLEPVAPPVWLQREAPQGITRDESDSSFWICFALSLELLHLSAELEPIEEVELDLPMAGLLFDGLSGIAYNSTRDTLFVVRPTPVAIWEVHKDGTPTGNIISPSLPAPPTLNPRPYAKGLAIDPRGDAGRGSFWIVESGMTAIYELSSGGDILRSFCHPDDPDGCPGTRRAAYASDVKLHSGPQGELLEIIGGTERRNLLRRVDRNGALTGLTYNLDEVGGVPSGFLRGTYVDPGSGVATEVFYVLVESTSELHVLAITEPRLLPLLDLRCVRSSDAVGHVDLAWRNTDRYERIEVSRDGEKLAVLEGSVTTFRDESPTEGILAYELSARREGCETSALCSILIGPGSVLAAVSLDARQAVDLTEDPAGGLWVTVADNAIEVFDKNLEPLSSVPSPFREPGDVTTGIAYNPIDATFFVYDTNTHRIVEMDPFGETVAGPFPSGVVDDPTKDEAIVTSMLFDPDGDGGDGAFWYVELLSGTIQQRKRDGTLLQECVHPDHLAAPPPVESRLHAYAWGVTAVPGRAHGVLELPGGRVRDGRATRILRIDTATCSPTAEELPIEAVAELATPTAVAVHRSVHDGRDVVYAILSHPSGSRILELDAARPAVPHVADLSCSQPRQEPDVHLEFRHPGTPDSIEIRRNEEVVVTLPGDATGFIDRAVAPGDHTYRVRARMEDRWSDDRHCSLRVGVGSLVRRAFAHPASFLNALAFDPRSRLYVAASSATSASDALETYDTELQYAGDVPSPFDAPYKPATLAVRETGTGSELHCLGWRPGASPGVVDFPVRVIDAGGRVLNEYMVTLPAPPAPLVTFPSGMAWDRATDTFFCLERNGRLVVRLTLEGEVIASFAHPAPIHQDGVHNFGLAIDAARGTLYLTSARRTEHRITRLVEVTRTGSLTGLEIPIGAPGYNQVWAFTLGADGKSFVLAAGVPGPWDLVHLRAETAFVRGEAVPDGRIGVTDAIAILSYLFSGGAAPSCLDSADIDDNGVIDISDSVRLLAFLFLGGDPPRPPYPTPGTDPTDDDLVCLGSRE